MGKYIKPIITLLFGACVYAFWAVFFRAALSYQEQFQLFLLDGDYFAQHLSWPGGLATYIAEFFVQFYNNYWIGALIIAASLAAVQWLTYRLTCRLAGCQSKLAFVISFLPAIALWMYMGDINHMPTFTFTVIFALIAAIWFTVIKSKLWRIVFSVVAIPAFFWVAGSTVYLLAALMCVIACFGRGSIAVKALVSLVLIAYAAAMPFISATFVNYPLSQILIGINYYRLWSVMPTLLPLTWALTLCSVIAGVVVARNAKFANSIIASGIAAGIVIVGAFFGIKGSFQPLIYDLVDYDYLLRTSNWDAIINKAERSQHHTQLSVCATNLALGMKGQLHTRAFDFMQNGVDGLIPDFQNDANSTMVTGEIYFQLGLINTAQRFAFEALEANPNFKKSSRCVKRLAETNIIRGNYDIAEKYLKMLDKTLVYGKWADRMRNLINSPAALESHPLYGRLKGGIINDSFLFSEQELDKVLGHLFLANPQNELATQYLLMYPLLQRDLNKFMQYLSVVQEHKPYRSPISQQAVVMAYVQAGKEVPSGVIDPATMRQFQDFAQIMTSRGKDSQALDRFRNTLWYYLLIN